MSSSDFKPMLASGAPADLTTLRYPVLVSAKLDGIRCIIRNGIAVSRKLLPIPNRYVQEQLKGLPDGFDGELMLADLDNGRPASFNAVQSAVMSEDGQPDFFYFVFDWDRPDEGGVPYQFHERLARADNWLEKHPCARADTIKHLWCDSAVDVEGHESVSLQCGYEGLMIRDPKGPYKYGRSTTKEGYLLKLKRFEDTEATIIGVEEFMHNENELGVDEVGHAKRSSAKAGKRPGGKLGALVCRTPEGVQFNIGSGFTDEQRHDFWLCRNEIIGYAVTYKHQPIPGGPGCEPGAAPRFPVFRHLRKD